MSSQHGRIIHSEARLFRLLGRAVSRLALLRRGGLHSGPLPARLSQSAKNYEPNSLTRKHSFVVAHGLGENSPPGDILPDEILCSDGIATARNASDERRLLFRSRLNCVGFSKIAQAIRSPALSAIRPNRVTAVIRMCPLVILPRLLGTPMSRPEPAARDGFCSQSHLRFPLT